MSAVRWHDLECGVYAEDLPLWTALARECWGPVLDVGAGTGRVTLPLARDGIEVVAVDLDPELLDALRERARGLPVETVLADARELDLGDRRFPLCIVPMQTIQLLGGAEGRGRFLAAARQWLTPQGLLAVAISPEVEEFVWHEGDPYPLPDLVEEDGNVYASQPTAVRREGETVVLERRRQVIGRTGERSVSEDRVVLDVVRRAQLSAEAVRAGLRPAGTRRIAATDQHVGAEVVIFSA